MRKSAAILVVMATIFGARVAGRDEVVSRELYLMGTRAQLATRSSGRAEGLQTLDRAVRVLEATEAELSTWREDSVISRLNRHPVGIAVELPHALCDTFAALYEWHTATAGTFDPAIGRMTDAWGIHAGGRVPPEAILRHARAESGLQQLAFDRERCEVTRRTNATIDVGAFGKGEALDRVERVLGDTAWMIDLGGQVSVHVPASDAPWQVAVAHPRQRDRELFHLQLRDGSLSTSGASERDLEANGQRVGHILDPRSGVPAPFSGSVLVFHRRALVADILSTALYVMGPVDGLAFAERRGLAACFLVPEADGSVGIVATPAFRQLLS